MKCKITVTYGLNLYHAVDKVNIRPVSIIFLISPSVYMKYQTSFSGENIEKMKMSPTDFSQFANRKIA